MFTFFSLSASACLAKMFLKHQTPPFTLFEFFGLALLSAYLFCGLPIFFRTCPPELREDISTLLYGSSRCAELTDFSHIRPMFVAKYGKEFVSAAEELRPGCGVNGRVS